MFVTFGIGRSDEINPGPSLFQDHFFKTSNKTDEIIFQVLISLICRGPSFKEIQAKTDENKPLILLGLYFYNSKL